MIFDPPIPSFAVLQNAGFITMDGPRHNAHRKTCSPVSSPRNLKQLEPLIRERVAEILDGLPVGETFDWVDNVSIELTTRMLATMFDFPRAAAQAHLLVRHRHLQPGPAQGPRDRRRRRRAPRCSSASTSSPSLWHERKGEEAESLDFVTALANADATQDLDPVTYLGTADAADRRRQRHDPQLDLGRRAGAEREPGEYEKLRKTRASSRTWSTRSSAGRPRFLHASHRHAGHRARRQADQEGREGRDVVRLGESRRGRDRERARVHHRSQEVANEAPLLRLGCPLLHGEPASPRCRCVCSGKRS